MARWCENPFSHSAFRESIPGRKVTADLYESYQEVSIKMNTRIKLTVVTLSLLAAASIGSGCRKSEHRSVQTYEYRSEPAPPPQPVYTPDPIERQKTNELDSEYKMVSPGEMRGR